MTDPMKEKTKLIASGRPHKRPSHPVNFPVERASTILFPTYDDFVEGRRKISYGRIGTSNHRALEEAITMLEGGVETRLAPSGLQACVASILAFVEAGDQVLMTDGAYDPTRKFADRFLRRFGVEVVYFPADIGEGISELVTEKTKVVFAESPSSITFEVQDMKAIVDAARSVGARVVVDNTWSAGLYYKPIAHGAHVSIQACTKYLSGHSDCLVGSITCADEAAASSIFAALLQLGSNVSADDAFLTLRGLRPLAARMPVHEKTGIRLAKWLNKRPEVDRVLHPALKSCPGHAIWKRDFTGASGLFSIVLKPLSQPEIKSFFNALRLFGMGFSWGGFESLCIHMDPSSLRTAAPWPHEGPLFRIHAGLEEYDDLIMDLERGFGAMARAKGGSE